MNQIGPGVVTIIGGIIGLAIVAVLVSQQAQTGTILSQAGGSLAKVIGAAVAPVSNGNQFGAAGIGSALNSLLTNA